MTPAVCRPRIWFAAALLLPNLSCYQPSYELSLYEGAERLADGRHFEYQKARKDCGVAAAAMMLRLAGREIDYGTLRGDVRLARDGLSLAQIRDLMLRYRLASHGVKVNPSNLDGVTLPLLAWLPTQHIVVIESVTASSAIISDPGRGRWKVSRARLSREWDGTALVPVEASARPPLAGMWSDSVRTHFPRGPDQ